MGLAKTDFLITDSTNNDLLYRFKPDGRVRGRGQKPRDLKKDPIGFAGPPSEIRTIPRNEWSARIKEMEETKSRLSDLRGDIPSLDQGQVGYCWGHSTVHAAMLARVKMNQPYVPLSAYSVCATIKNGRDEGGWCGLSLKFVKEKGIAPQSLWPQGNRFKRWSDVAEEAKKYISIEDYYDLSKAEWDQTMRFEEVFTCLLLRIPLAIDFNWWGHSVCGMDPVEIEPGSYGVRIWNSWGDRWGDRGSGVLEGTKAIPDAGVGIRLMVAAA